MNTPLSPDPERAFRLVSWNVAGRTSRKGERIQAIRRLQPDILALQETTAGNLPTFREALPDLGLVHVLDSRTLAAHPAKLIGPRKYGELLASRWPLDAFAPSGFEVPWPERILSALVRVPGVDVEIHVAHLPTGVGHGWLKIETFEGIFDRLARPSATPRILCGDFNSPQAEGPGGEIITWGQDVGPDGRGTPPPGDENWDGDDAAWDSGERSVLEAWPTMTLATSSVASIPAPSSTAGSGAAEARAASPRRSSAVSTTSSPASLSAPSPAATCRACARLG